jgi:hypothetical protein
MFKSGFILSTEAHIAAAIHNRTRINIWQAGKMMDYSYVIEDQDELTVTIDGGKYLKSLCEFRVC